MTKSSSIFWLMHILFSSLGLIKCPSDWLHIDDHCYYFSNKSSSWSEAQNDCRARGGDLAVPENSDINEKIYQVLKSRNIGTVWIGVHRDDNDKFITVSGAGVSYTNWYPREPNNGGGNEDCVELMNIVYWTKNGAGRWNDARCTLSRSKVCELNCRSQT